MEEETELLKVENLSIGIKAGKEWLLAVRDLSFHIDNGEILGIVGESGCGKSLTALSIPGLLPPEAAKRGGSIVFGGRDLAALSAKELSALRGKDISMIFQEPMSSLNPLMKIGKQVAEPLKLHGWKNKAQIRAETLETLAKVGLRDSVAECYPHQLSGGMQQRVMIAQAVIDRPALIIADEPTTALDLKTQGQIIDLLKAINTDLGASILFISHDLAVIRSLCKRVLVMYSGKIVEEASVEDLFARPSHPYTRGLLSSIPGKADKGRPLKCIPGKVPSIEEPLPGCPFAPRCSLAESSCVAAFPKAWEPSPGHLVYCINHVYSARHDAEAES
jgi:oligopeptide/dipeptide ABC transporter ATP-binding protein